VWTCPSTVISIKEAIGCEKSNGEAGRTRSGWNLGVASRKEVENTIDIRGVADVAQFHVEIEKTVEVIHFNRECWSIGEMVNEGVDLA
jgi:hypothetical protein